MNSLVSYDWLSEYVDLKGLTPEEFARRMSLSGPAVEKLIPQGKDLEKIVVGHVLEVKPHPNADKLRVASVDCGEETLSIVCGGTNLKADQWVVVAKVGASVRWHGEGDPIVLEPIELRGVPSQGMICAANEVGLGDAFPADERHIMDLGHLLPEMKLVPGTPLADALGLSDDVVMDIEVTSNRVDAMGMAGMAREASAILGRDMKWDAPSEGKTPLKADKTGPKVKISTKKLCGRFMAAKIEGLTVGVSPWWMKRRLLSAGIRPINTVVDITNYVLLELAQPMHAYDAGKLIGGLNARLARVGEKIKALDGKEYNLDDSILVIADANEPVCIAGIMGGQESGVSVATTSIVLEAATFDSLTVRRGARKLNLQSDAQLRFEKGLSTQAPPDALARAIGLVLELCGGKLVGISDEQVAKYKPLKFSVTTDEVTGLIGVPLPQKKMLDTLRRLGFHVKTTGKKMTALVPWWRDHDIEEGRDLVEEIARVEGYANIPAVLPIGPAAKPTDSELVWESRIRQTSKTAGLTETYSYSFVSKDLLAKADFDATQMLHVQNPLTADFEVMRTSLLPSLLQVANENRERFSDQRLFELANVYVPSAPNWTDLPSEQLELGALFIGMNEPWRVAKGYVEHVLDSMGLSQQVGWKRLDKDDFWHPGRTVQAFHDGKLVATVGEVSPKIARNFKLEGPVGLVHMPLEHVIAQATTAKTYTPVSPFPEAKRDIAIMVDHHVEYDDVARQIKRMSPLVSSVDWFDTYRGKNLPEGKKSLAMHLAFSSQERTLESAEVDAMMENIVLSLKEHFKAEMRG